MLEVILGKIIDLDKFVSGTLQKYKAVCRKPLIEQECNFCNIML